MPHSPASAVFAGPHPPRLPSPSSAPPARHTGIRSVHLHHRDARAAVAAVRWRPHRLHRHRPPLGQAASPPVTGRALGALAPRPTLVSTCRRPPCLTRCRAAGRSPGQRARNRQRPYQERRRRQKKISETRAEVRGPASRAEAPIAEESSPRLQRPNWPQSRARPGPARVRRLTRAVLASRPRARQPAAWARLERCVRRDRAGPGPGSRGRAGRGEVRGGRGSTAPA